MMPDREKAIETLERMLSNYDMLDDIVINKNNEMLMFHRAIAKEALTLLKEQEPLAVYEDKVNKCVCGNEINRYWHPEYCGFCGKKLEWY